MRRALILSVVLVSGCHQASAPPADDASGKSNAVKANKEMSDLLRKADALAAANSAPPVAAPQPVVQPPVASAKAPAAAADAHPATPAPPKTDATRDQAAAVFGDRLRALRRTAEATRLKKDRYQQVC